MLRFLGCLVLLSACGTAEPDEVPAEDTGPDDTVDPDTFRVVVLPDTQIYAQRYPKTFDAQLRWVAENAEALNIVFVSHVGDIVQTADADDEWAVARAAYDWLEDAGIPYGFSVGGHDFSVSGSSTDHDASCANFGDVDCAFTDYLANFAPERFEDRSWWAGHSASGFSSAQRVSAGGLDLLFVHLPQDPPEAEVQWAHEVLDAHPGTLAHLTTHRYLYDYRLTDAMPAPLNLLPAGRFNPVTYLLGGQTLKFHDSVSAERLFTELVAVHPNLWGVHCGHVDAEFRQTSENAAGLPVYEVLNDFQDMDDGGGGWLRVLTFEPNRDRITVETYSPVFDRTRDNGEGFDHSLKILGDYMGQAVEALGSFGLGEDELNALLEDASTPGATQDELYASLYDDGSRDSTFVLEVDFSAYVAAAQ